MSIEKWDGLPDGTADAVVIGGGAAGLNAAMMLGRSRRLVVVIDGGEPRNAPAAAVHGLLGHDGTPPAELLARGRAEVRRYGGLVVAGAVVDARPAEPSGTGDLRFAITLADGRTLRARRVLVATGVRDVLPDVPGLAEHWGRGVVHCPYCHGWEVRDEPIGVLAAGAASVHHALLFRQLSADLVFFTRGTGLDEETRERLTALGIRIVDAPVEAVVADEDGGIAGVRLSGGEVVPRRVLAVASRMEVRGAGLEGLGLETREFPGGYGHHFVAGMAGSTEVPGVWVAGNAAEPTAQVGASAAAGALAGAHMNADLVRADADAAVAEPVARRPVAA